MGRSLDAVLNGSRTLEAQSPAAGFRRERASEKGPC
jgi:hypothetical protein